MNDNPTNADEQYKLGEMYEKSGTFDGTFIPYNQEKAIYWFTKAAEQNHHDAMTKLSGFYYSKDPQKYQYWSERAINLATNENIRNNYSGGSSGCYVATCVYGSYDCPEVWTLRRFRDNILSDLWFGRGFIQVYYSVSPKIVELFGNTKWFNRLWKLILDRFVRKLQNKGIDDSPYSNM